MSPIDSILSTASRLTKKIFKRLHRNVKSSSLAVPSSASGVLVRLAIAAGVVSLGWVVTRIVSSSRTRCARHSEECIDVDSAPLSHRDIEDNDPSLIKNSRRDRPKIVARAVNS